MQPPGSLQADGGLAAGEAASRLTQHRGNGGEVAVVHALQPDIAAGAGGGRQIGSGHDAVRHHRMYAAMEGCAALHHHGGAARPLHMGAHFLQKGLQIHDLRLTGGVGDDGSSLCTAGRQHGVLRGSHAGEAQHDLRAGKALPAAGQPSAGLLNGRSHAPQRRKAPNSQPPG